MLDRCAEAVMSGAVMEDDEFTFESEEIVISDESCSFTPTVSLRPVTTAAQTTVDHRIFVSDDHC